MNHIYTLDIGSSQDFATGLLLKRHRRFQEAATYTGRIDGYTNKNVVMEKHVTYAWRPPLKTPYETIVEDTYQFLRDPRLAGDCYLVVDRGNAGQAVIERMIMKGLAPIGVTATGGENVTSSTQGAGWNVPKRDLINALRIELEQNRLIVARGMDHEDQLRKEMLAFQGKVNKRTLNMSYEAMREQDHDDMVMALAQGIWFSNRVWPEETLIPEPKKGDEYDPINVGVVMDRPHTATDVMKSWEDARGVVIQGVLDYAVERLAVAVLGLLDVLRIPLGCERPDRRLRGGVI